MGDGRWETGRPGDWETGGLGEMNLFPITFYLLPITHYPLPITFYPYLLAPIDRSLHRCL